MTNDEILEQSLAYVVMGLKYRVISIEMDEGYAELQYRRTNGSAAQLDSSVLNIIRFYIDTDRLADPTLNFHLDELTTVVNSQFVDAVEVGAARLAIGKSRGGMSVHYREPKGTPKPQKQGRLARSLHCVLEHLVSHVAHELTCVEFYCGSLAVEYVGADDLTRHQAGTWRRIHLALTEKILDAPDCAAVVLKEVDKRLRLYGARTMDPGDRLRAICRFPKGNWHKWRSRIVVDRVATGERDV